MSIIRCIGSTQHLKDRHGSGYTMEVKLGGHGTDGNRGGDNAEGSEDHIKRFSAAVEEVFPGASLVESFGERLTFKVSLESVGALSRVFTWFEEGEFTEVEMGQWYIACF